MRNRFIRNFQFEPENFKRLIKKHGRETTLITFQLNSEDQIRQAKHYGITSEGIVYDIRKYVDKEKKLLNVSNVINLGILQIIVNNRKGVLDAII